MGEGYAQFLQDRGRRIVEAAGALWFNTSVGGRFYMSLPDQLALSPPPDELEAKVETMMRASGAAVARFPVRAGGGVDSGIYICRDKNYGLQTVQPRQRNRVRRGLERCEIRRVEREELLTQGLALNLDTMGKQGRFDAEYGDCALWKRYVDALYRSPAMFATGAFVEGRLAAYIVGCREDGWVHLLDQMSRSADLGAHPNHALTFSAIQRAIGDPEIEAVTCGPMALAGKEGLHSYKLQFGYEVMPQVVAYRFHPLVAPLASSAAAVCLTRGVQRVLDRSSRQSGERWARLAAVVQGAHAFRRGQLLPLAMEGQQPCS